MQDEGRTYREAVTGTPLVDLANRAVAITRGGQRLWIAGVDDPGWGKPDLGCALEGVRTGGAGVLLCHNPDFMEEMPDPRVGLALCGRTHGGQIYLPSLGASYPPSRYGMKYRHGLVQGRRRGCSFRAGRAGRGCRSASTPRRRSTSSRWRRLEPLARQR